MRLKPVAELVKYLAILTGKTYDRVSDDLEENPKVTLSTIVVLFMVGAGILALTMAGAFGGIAIWHEFNKQETNFFLKCNPDSNSGVDCIEDSTPRK